MRINPEQAVLNYEGEPVSTPGAGGQEPLTLRRVIVQALNSVPAQGKPLTAEQKQMAFKISVRASLPGKPLDLTPEDMVFIKERVSLAYPSPLIYGRVSEVFDGEKMEE